jgi:anti-sigma-K factor RskA
MTPSETFEKTNPPADAATGELASLIEACGRDERPALQALYERTAPMLFGRAVAATDSRLQAEQVLVQTYLAVFAEASSFDPVVEEPAAWLANVLSRQLPDRPAADQPSRVTAAPIAPPGELWQKLDIGLGLQRLDRHIKPGVATQARGRDPMPNAYDRRIERQLRFWRVAAVSSFVSFALAGALVGAVAYQGGPPAPPETAGPRLTEARAALPTAEPTRIAILRAGGEGRVWRVDLEGGDLRVQSLPPFTQTEGASRPGTLALWVVRGRESAPSSGLDVEPQAVLDGEKSLRWLADLDPATTTSITLPDEMLVADLEERGLELIISLEPSDGVATTSPSGPVLFAGRLDF